MRIVTGLFGGKTRSEKILQGFRPTGFSAPGAQASFDRNTNTFTLNRTPQRDEALAGVVSGYQERAAAIAGLRPQVAPGFGRLSEIRSEGLRSRISAFRDAAQKSVGNLREQLARRRLGGSTFQSREVASAQAAFAQQEDIIRADANEQEATAFLQEIGLTSQLIAEQFDASVAASQAVLTDLNFDTATVAQLASQASQLFHSNLTAQAEARAAGEQAGEDFLGTVLGLFSGKGIFN